MSVLHQNVLQTVPLTELKRDFLESIRHTACQSDSTCSKATQVGDVRKIPLHSCTHDQLDDTIAMVPSDQYLQLDDEVLPTRNTLLVLGLCVIAIAKCLCLLNLQSLIRCRMWTLLCGSITCTVSCFTTPSTKSSSFPICVSASTIYRIVTRRFLEN